MSRRTIKVIYIVGSGRSGSTLLDTVLGNHEHIESVGELVNAPRSWTSIDEYCACGELASSCAHWEKVRNEWAVLTPWLKQNEEWISIQREFERLRHIGRVFKACRDGDQDFQSYANGVIEMYRAIQRVSGKPVILDSSKNPIRALALSRISEIDLRLIHLVRDGRGVAWSLKKGNKKNAAEGVQRDLPSRPIIRSAAAWWIANNLTEVIAKRVASENRCRIRYEDFISEPSVVLHTIGKICGLDLTLLSEMLTQGTDFPVGHTIAGNRMRMTGKVTVRPDLEWRLRLNAFEKRVFWIVAGRVAQRYGYERET